MDMTGENIRVLDGDCKLIQVIEMEHTNSNIAIVAKRFVSVLGKVLNTDASSDCISIVTFEKGILGFSI
jgi:hypothetical protein